MKKHLAWMMMAILVLLTACSGNSPSSAGEHSSSGDQKTVVIAVTGSNRFLETAAQKFEDLHPDIHIEIKEYLAMPKTDGGTTSAISQADMEKYVQTVTTQALSGKASDLIDMTNLPQDKFVSKNVLVNLYDLMAQDSTFDKSRYYENILKSSQNGDGLYAMPFSFSPQFVAGKKSVLEKAGISIDDKTWTWGQFKNIAKKLQDQVGQDYVAFVNLLPNQLLADYIEKNYSDLIQDGKANFDSELFRGMMNEIKSMYDEGILQAEFSYDYDKALFSMTSLYNPAMDLINVLKEDTQLFNRPTSNGQSGGGEYSSYFTLGLNSKSQVQQEAWEFLKFLLSDEMQSSPELPSGYPIHKGIVDKKFHEAKEKLLQGGTLEVSGFPVEVPDNLDMSMVDERIATMKQQLENASKKLTSDMKVFSIAMEEFEAFMNGQKTAEEVSKLIQNRVTTYLNE